MIWAARRSAKLKTNTNSTRRGIRRDPNCTAPYVSTSAFPLPPAHGTPVPKPSPQKKKGKRRNQPKARNHLRRPWPCFGVQYSSHPFSCTVLAMAAAAAAAVAPRSGLRGRSCSGLPVAARVRVGGVVGLVRMRHGTAGGRLAAARRLLAASAGPGASLSLPEAAVVEEAEEKNTASTGVLPPPDMSARTVHVKFLLQKQCGFGQRFLLVGDDRALGLWDPTNAIALDWSDGNVWTGEIDLPANKLIEFKFLLMDSLGRVRWQGGPNRTLQTSETSNSLVVYEDWDDTKKQKISEEGEPAIEMEGVIFSVVDMSVNGAAVDGRQTREHEAQKASSVKHAPNGVDDENKPTVADESSILASGLQNSAVPTNASLPVESVKANEAKSSQFILPEDGDVTAADADHIERAADGNVLSEKYLPIENGSVGIIENDVLWGYKALQRFLTSLGFKMDPTETT